MFRISRLDNSEVTPEIAARYDKRFALRGNWQNMFRELAHAPEILAAIQTYFVAVLNTDSASANFKQISFFYPHESI